MSKAIRKALLRFVDATNQIATGQVVTLDGLPVSGLVDVINDHVQGESPLSTLAIQLKKLGVMIRHADLFQPSEFAWEADRTRDLLDEITPRANLLTMDQVLVRIAAVAAAQREPDATLQ